MAVRFKPWCQLGAALALLCLGACWWVLHQLVPYALLQPPRHLTPPSAETARIVEQAEELTWTARDGLQLRAHRYGLLNPIGRFVVVHGISSCKEDQASLCRWLGELGFETIAVDLRAHGASEGEYCTFGSREKDDLGALLDRYPSDLPTWIWGSSLGGAVALQTLAFDERFAGGIVFSAFATLEEIALDRQEQLSGLRWAWARDYWLSRCGVIAGIDPSAVAPELACRSIEQPVFLVHGTLDTQISVDCAHRNLEALTSTDKVLMEVDGAGHNDLWERGGDELRTALEDFIAANIVR